ncbi:MAG TPA: helix-hairpin-helix domain-containing protein, partial [Gemmatimonadales bacterium]|nr:helix-hairpin-helix domain-containing protein [Gemmatimonadales bacterium]
MDKRAAAHVLESIASLLELKGENPFKVRAFRAAAEVVESYPGDLAHALDAGSLAELKGIGPATLEVIREAVLTGRSSALESLQREVPAGLVEMRRIPGLGVTKIRALREQLGITSVAELAAAARDGRLAALPRFGEKTAQKILNGIEFVRRASGFRLSNDAARGAEEVRRMLAAMPGIERVEVAGSVRRRSEVVRDLDLVAVSAGSVPPVATADVYAVSADRFGHAWVRATGSARHWEKLVERAAQSGCRLDEAGLWRDGAAVPCPDEEALYAALGLAWIPPELREGRDEIARAAAGTLPRLVAREDLRGFVHCHSVYSDGADAPAVLADACRDAGYRYLGLTDHSVAAAYAGGMGEAKVLKQHQELDALSGLGGFRVLKGIEADILADGALDYAPDLLDRFEFVIGSVHSRMEQDEATMTRRVLHAMDDPHLTVLGHPTGRLLLARDPYAIDMHAVIARAAERGVAIEINGDPHRLDLDWRLCAEARDAGVKIVIGADAHSLAGLENAEWGLGIARKGGLEAGDILN